MSWVTDLFRRHFAKYSNWSVPLAFMVMIFITNNLIIEVQITFFSKRDHSVTASIGTQISVQGCDKLTEVVDLGQSSFASCRYYGELLLP